jgi:hypothetical protein
MTTTPNDRGPSERAGRKTFTRPSLSGSLPKIPIQYSMSAVVSGGSQPPYAVVWIGSALMPPLAKLPIAHIGLLSEGMHPDSRWLIEASGL